MIIVIVRVYGVDVTYLSVGQFSRPLYQVRSDHAFIVHRGLDV